MELVELRPKEAELDTVELLEAILERAKTADVLGVAIVALHRDEYVGTAWSPFCANNVFKMLGAIEHLKQRFYNEAVED